jgi:hypothetical protein
MLFCLKTAAHSLKWMLKARNCKRGARRTIERHRPILAVSLYHKPEDILTIPDFIKTLVPEYRLYICAHCKPMTTEMVLYAVPPQRMK